MTEYSHPILSRGRYRLVALTPEAEYDLAKVTGYAVLSPAGARLRCEPNLEDARLWVDRLIEQESMQRVAPAPVRAVERRR